VNNLGHYLRDNSEELYLSVRFKPLRGLHINLSYTHAKHGTDYTYGAIDPWGVPFMENTTWENKTFSTKAYYEIINDGFIFAEYMSSNITGNVDEFTPVFFHGYNNTISLGINYGFYTTYLENYPSLVLLKDVVCHSLQ
jgi:hypothetical protein